MLDWRATSQERREELPGDELVPEAPGNSTHAITIRAMPAEIWPWLVQMGCDRSGFYSYDRLDNGGPRQCRKHPPGVPGHEGG
jgi:proline iminopeptidase